MKAIALAAISAYQAHLSPLKGFGCAYRVHTGACSCSALGHRAIRMHGVLGGLMVLRKRMHRCGVAQRRFGPNQPAKLMGARQRGVCDLSCDLPLDGNCEMPSMRWLSGLCDVASCCDVGSCDWKRGDKTKRRRQEARVHIPVRRGRH
jgi:uncharacterized protein